MLSWRHGLSFAIGLAAAAGALLAATGLAAQSADLAPPQISFGALRPGATVRADAYGRVFLAARATDDRGIRAVVLNVPHASAVLTPSPPTPWAMVRAMWDSREDPAGPYTITCTATDTAGKVTTQALPITLVK